MPAISDEFKNDMEEAFKDVKPIEKTANETKNEAIPNKERQVGAVQDAEEVREGETKPVLANTATKVTKPVEADPDDEIISGKRSPKSEDFKRVKSKAAEFAGKYETAEQERKRLETELATAKSKPAVDPAEVETLRKELAASKEQFSTVALEFMPEFNAKYQQRVDKVKGDLKGLAPEKAEQLFGVLAMPNSKAKAERMAELLEDMDERTKFKVYRVDDDLEAIQTERQSELKASQDKLNTIVEGRKATAKQRQEALETTFNTTMEELTKDNPLYQVREGDSEWNANVKERIALAKAIYSGNAEPKQVARLAALGVSNNILVGTIQAKDARIKELEAQIVSYQGSNPGVRGGGGGAKPEPKSFGEDFEAGMKGE